MCPRKAPRQLSAGLPFSKGSAPERQVWGCMGAASKPSPAVCQLTVSSLKTSWMGLVRQTEGCPAQEGLRRQG